MARLPYLEADQVAPEYRDMLKRNTPTCIKLLVNSPDMARAFNGIGGLHPLQEQTRPRGCANSQSFRVGWMEKSEYEFTPSREGSARSSASPMRISPA